ncbi:MAG: hypothetical protein D6681_13610, partial [Calditrichaeota bacterium]
LAKWLSGKIAMHLGHIDEARGRLEEALHLCRRQRLPQIHFQMLRDLAVLEQASGEEAKFRRLAEEAHRAFSCWLSVVGDEILQRQLQESAEYETLAQLSSGM